MSQYPSYHIIPTELFVLREQGYLRFLDFGMQILQLPDTCPVKPAPSLGLGKRYPLSSVTTSLKLLFKNNNDNKD